MCQLKKVEVEMEGGKETEREAVTIVGLDLGAWERDLSGGALSMWLP